MRINTLYFVILLTLILAFTACDDFLDVKPQSNLTAESFWKTDRDANVGVISIYNAFAQAMSPGLWDWGELRADNFYHAEADSPDQGELISNEILIDNQAASWTTLYDVIGKANAAIKYIPKINMLPSLKNHYLAEAYAMRAWAYYYAVRVWGDVPLYLEPIEEITQGIYRQRSDKNYIIDSVIVADLEKAYSMIDKTNLTKIRMNVGTICVLLMDVYSWLGDYEKVIKIKEEKVNLLDFSPDNNVANKWLYLVQGGSDFSQNWRALFIESPAGTTSNEVWFKVSYDRYGNGINQSVRYFGAGSSRLLVSDKLAAAYSSSDVRGKSQWIIDWPDKKRLRLKFWPTGTAFSGTGTVISENDLVIYRYADVVLLYAEALCQTGKINDAIKELNKTHVRAGNEEFNASSFATQDDLLDAILKERQKEFVGEGKRWFDIVRTNRWQENSTLTDPVKILFPVHRDHLNQNPELTQNYPAYPYP